MHASQDDQDDIQHGSVQREHSKVEVGVGVGHSAHDDYDEHPATVVSRSRARSRPRQCFAWFAACRAASVSMMWCTPSGSSTTLVPSHRALLVNSVHSSLMSTS